MIRRTQQNIRHKATEGWRLSLIRHVIKYFELDVRLPNKLLCSLHLVWYALSGIWSSNLYLLDSLTMDKIYDQTQSFGPFVSLAFLLATSALFAVSILRTATDTNLYKIAYLLLLAFRYVLYPYTVMLTGVLFGRAAFEGAAVNAGTAAVLLIATILGFACVVTSLMFRNTFPSGTGQGTTSNRDILKYACVTLATFIGSMVESAPNRNVLAIALKLLSCLLLLFAFSVGFGCQLYWNGSLNPISSAGISFILCSTFISTIFRIMGYSKGNIVFIIIFLSILWKAKMNLKLISFFRISQQKGFQRARTMFNIIWAHNYDLTTQDPKALHGDLAYQHLYACSSDPLDVLIALLFSTKDLSIEGMRLLACCLIFHLPKGLYSAKSALDLLQKDQNSGFLVHLECYHLQLLIERRLSLTMNNTDPNEPLFIRDVYRKSSQGTSSAQDYLKLEHPLNCESEHNEMISVILKLLEIKQQTYSYLQSDHLISMKKLMEANRQLNSKKAFLTNSFVNMSERPDSAPFQLCVAFAFLGKVTYNLNLGHKLFKIFRMRTEVINREINRISVGVKKVTSVDELFLGVTTTCSLQQGQLGKITDASWNTKDIFGVDKKEVIGKNINSIFPSFLQETHLGLMKKVSQSTFSMPKEFTICGFDSDVRQVVANLGLIANVTKDISSVAAIWAKKSFEYSVGIFDKNFVFAASEKSFKRLLLQNNLNIVSGMRLYHLSRPLYKYILISRIQDQISESSFKYTTVQQDQVIRILKDFINKGKNLISYSASYLRTEIQDMRILARFSNGSLTSEGYLIVEVKEFVEARIRRSDHGKTLKLKDISEDSCDSLEEILSLEWKDVGSEHDTIEELAHEANRLIQMTYPKDHRERKALLKKADGDSELKRILKYLTKIFGFKEENTKVLSDFYEGELPKEKYMGTFSSKWAETKNEIAANKVAEPTYELKPSIISDAHIKRSFNTMESGPLLKGSSRLEHEKEDSKLVKRTQGQKTPKSVAFQSDNPCLRDWKSNLLVDDKVANSLDSASLKIARGRRAKEENEENDGGDVDGNALIGSQSSQGKKKNSVTVYGQIQGIITRPMNFAHSNRLVFLLIILLTILVLFMSLIHQTTINTQAKNLVDFNFLTIKASNDNSLRKLLSIQMPVYELLKLYFRDQDPKIIYQTYASIGNPTPMLTFLEQLEESVKQMRKIFVDSQVELNSKLKGDEGLQLTKNLQIDFNLTYRNEFNEIVGVVEKMTNVNKLLEYFESELSYIASMIREVYAVVKDLPFVYPRNFDQSFQAKLDKLDKSVISVYKNIFEGYFGIDEEIYNRISASVVDTSFEAYVSIGTTLLSLFGALMILVVINLWIFVAKWVNSIYQMVVSYTELKSNELRVQLEVLASEREMFDKYSMNQKIMTGVLFNLNSEDFKNKVEDNLRGGADKKDSNHRKGKNSNTDASIVRRTKTLQRDHTFGGAVGMVIVGLIALSVYAIFTVSVVFVVRESGRKIEIERFYSKNIEHFNDISNYFLTNMALLSDGNFYKFKNQFVEDLDLSPSIDKYISFWNTRIAGLNTSFEEDTEAVKTIIFGDTCSFMTTTDDSDPRPLIERCRGFLNGAAKNGGMLATLIYMKEFFGRYRHTMQTQYPVFLSASKTRTQETPNQIYYSKEFLEVRLLFRILTDIMFSKMTPIFLNRIKSHEAGELTIMTWKLTAAGVVGILGLIFAFLSVKRLRHDTRLGFETMRNICPYIVVNNALILNKYKHSFDSKII